MAQIRDVLSVGCLGDLGQVTGQAPVDPVPGCLECPERGGQYLVLYRVLFLVYNPQNPRNREVPVFPHST